MNDVVTLSKIFWTKDESRHEIGRISSSLDVIWLHIIRKKVWIAVWYEYTMREKLKDGQYFECYVSLFISLMNKEERMAKLSSLCKMHSANLSKNLIKREADEKFVQITTIRIYSLPYSTKILYREFFEKKIDMFAKDLTKNEIKCKKWSTSVNCLTIKITIAKHGWKRNLHHNKYFS